MAPTDVGIVTPEAVLLEFDEAGLGSRALAFLIDLAVRAIILWAAIVAGTALSLSVGNTAAIVLLIASVFGLVIVYPVAFEAMWDGRTPGKAAMGLRAVTVEGAPLRFRHAAIRSALGIVDFFLGAGTVAVMAALLTRRSQRVGDLAAGTIVVRERQVGAVHHAVVFPPPPGWEQYTATLDVTRLTDAAYVLVRTFLLRVHELDPAARFVRAQSLATAVAAHMGTPFPPGTDAEAFLVSVASAYQARHRVAPGPAAGPTAPRPVTEPVIDVDSPQLTWGAVAIDS